MPEALVRGARGGPAAPDAFVPVAYVYSQPEASVLLATLRAYGIFALTRDQDTIYAAPWLMVALGGIRVVVPEDQEEDALALLAAIDGGWSCPPRPFADEAWISLPLSLALALLGMGPPPPRVKGSYAWTRAQAESGLPAR